MALYRGFVGQALRRSARAAEGFRSAETDTRGGGGR